MIIRIYLKTLVLFCFVSCSRTNDLKPITDKGEVSMQNKLSDEIIMQVLKTANKEMTNEGFDVRKLVSHITQDSINFIVTFDLKDTTALGGGGTILISKSTMKVIDKKFHQ